ncbi:MAG: L-threonylcarbamoyladenylate synthase [Candidatus Woesebacteria bacterium]|jgi:L-threonylcarbamoyladenylate synthase
MKVFSSLRNPEVADLIKNGAVGVIPTDTLYGIVASVHCKTAIERLYKIRKRDNNKACIVIVSDSSQITDTDAWQTSHWQAVHQYWPGSVSIILPTTDKTPKYLQHGDQAPPYRVPDYQDLRKLIKDSGPVIAPSANPQSLPPATSLQQAQDYFGDTVDFYVDGDVLDGSPSTLICIEDDRAKVLRQGCAKIDDLTI